LIQIQPLKLYPEYAPVLALWSYNQWYRDKNIDFKTILKAYMERTEDDSIPLVYIALDDTMPVGMVSLKENILWSRKDLNPWLASLYVVPEYRNMGTGKMLIESISIKSGIIGHNRIYLFLEHSRRRKLKKYYSSMGWKFFDNGRDNDNRRTKIYYYDINSRAGKLK